MDPLSSGATIFDPQKSPEKLSRGEYGQDRGRFVSSHARSSRLDL